MHIDYIRKLSPTGELEEIELINYRACCEAMEYYAKLGIVAFGQRSEETNHNKLADVFIRVDNGAQRIGNDDNSKPNTDIALAYCPWCTSPVETHEVATV